MTPFVGTGKSKHTSAVLGEYLYKNRLISKKILVLYVIST